MATSGEILLKFDEAFTTFSAKVEPAHVDALAGGLGPEEAAVFQTSSDRFCVAADCERMADPSGSSAALDFGELIPIASFSTRSQVNSGIFTLANETEVHR